MKIQSTQQNQINFNSKVRFIPKNMHSDLKILLTKMNEDLTFTKIDDCNFDANVVKRISIPNKISFEDERNLTKKVDDQEQLQSFSKLNVGNNRLEIDNETGEIIDYKTPYYKPWFLTIREAAKGIKSLIDSYNNPNLVQKNRLNLHQLTAKGKEEINNFVKKMKIKELQELLKDSDKGSI